MPPSDSIALHFVKTAETGDGPTASASPVLAPETLADSLASAAASVMRWPPKLVWPLVGQANSSLPPSLLSLPAQKPEQRGPAPLDMVPVRKDRARLQLSAPPFGTLRCAAC